ncbi:hypothetical protein [Paucisalibacillus globulus]|uniref:hypothetical protein n=1 Tax=Paucisalibacillus globulus TaxID=351095 RepID=UPI000BB83351|nr:hypothetical protein [Paucisalibacillus globulus]
MSEFLKDHGIAIISLSVAIVALLLNKKNSKLNSYNQQGNYIVFFQKEGKIRRWLYGPQFSVKINNSIMSEVILFDYSLKIKPLLGGIYRAHLFDDINNEHYIGTIKTFPVIRPYKNRSKFSNKYAHQDMISFSTSPIYSYFSVNGKFINDEHYYEKRLCRYHRYIQITDYCGNTEVWFASFSLFLSNVKEDGDWKKCKENIRFKYYRFDDFNIVSPREIPPNLNATLQFNKDLSTISGIENEMGESERFIEQGYDKTNSELQLYEMKKYKSFLDNLHDYI